MIEHDVRNLGESEFREALDLFLGSVHYTPMTDDDWATYRDRHDDGRVFGARTGSGLAGMAMSFPSAVAVPGGATVPAAAVTAVGVRADQTRRGVLTALMRAQLDAVREQGEPIAMLRASETMIYGRFGYGMATRSRTVSLNRDTAVLRSDIPRGGSVRLIDVDTALRILPEIYREIGLSRPGTIERDNAWWRTLRMRDGMAVAVHTDESGRDDGFALYRVRHDGLNLPKNTLQLQDLKAADPTASVELWRFLLNLDLISDVLASGRPIDEPLEWWLRDQRRCQVQAINDDLWLRLVDVPTALNARAFAAAEPVVLEIRDQFLPSNSGCYRIGPDGVRRCTGPAQLGLDVDVLAALYLGDVTVSTLVAANRIEVSDPSAVSAADAAFRGSEIPWCGTSF